MLKTLIARAVVAFVAHRLFNWCAPHFSRRVPDAPDAQKTALVGYSRRKLWFGFLVGAMGALIVVTVGTA